MQCHLHKVKPEEMCFRIAGQICVRWMLFLHGLPGTLRLKRCEMRSVKYDMYELQG